VSRLCRESAGFFLAGRDALHASLAFAQPKNLIEICRGRTVETHAMRLYTSCAGYVESRRDSSWLVETHCMRLLLFAQPKNLMEICRARTVETHAMSLYTPCFGYAESRGEFFLAGRDALHASLAFCTAEKFDRDFSCQDRRDACNASLHPVFRLCRGFFLAVRFDMVETHCMRLLPLTTNRCRN